MIKPEKYQDLPEPVLEVILNDCDLDYDPYESSSDEVIAQVLRGTASEMNEKIVQTALDFISNTELIDICCQCIVRLENQLQRLKEFTDKKS